MAVTQGDLVLKKAENNSDTPSTNGGYMSGTTVSVALFPDITGAQRTAGKTTYRKIFFKNEAATTGYYDPALHLVDAKVFLENISPSDDYYLMKATADPTDVQEDIVDSDWAGTGFLETDVSADATTCQIRCEINGSAGEIFQIGGTVLLTEGLLHKDGSAGLKEFVVLTDVTWNGAVATLEFLNSPLQNSYTRNALTADRTASVALCDETHIGYTGDNMTSDALIGKRVRIKSGTGAGQIRRVVDNGVEQIEVEYAWTTVPDGTSVYEVLATHGCMCVDVGDIYPAYDNLTVAIGDGTYDENYLFLDPVGCRDENWTLNFTSATEFTITGDHYGAIAGTFTTTLAQPSNSEGYYFETRTGFFTGDWGTGDRLTFSTSSSAKGVWIKEVVPAGSVPHFASSVDIGASGDTV